MVQKKSFLIPNSSFLIIKYFVFLKQLSHYCYEKDYIPYFDDCAFSDKSKSLAT